MLLATVPQFVIKLRREIVGLAGMIVAGGGLLAYASFAPSLSTNTQHGWTGDLSAPAMETDKAAKISSASLVVPKSELALPPLPVKPPVIMRSSCDSADPYCVVRPALRVPRQVAALDMQGLTPKPMSSKAVSLKTAGQQAPRKSGIGALNPLSHVPDISGIGRPFIAAKDTVVSWMKGF